jgi:hypothetical protein
VTDEGMGELVGAWRIKDGEVVFDPEPSRKLFSDYPDPGDIPFPVPYDESSFIARERGVSEERLRQAVARVDASRRVPPPV